MDVVTSIPRTKSNRSEESLNFQKRQSNQLWQNMTKVWGNRFNANGKKHILVSDDFFVRWFSDNKKPSKPSKAIFNRKWHSSRQSLNPTLERQQKNQSSSHRTWGKWDRLISIDWLILETFHSWKRSASRTSVFENSFLRAKMFFDCSNSPMKFSELTFSGLFAYLPPYFASRCAGTWISRWRRSTMTRL